MARSPGVREAGGDAWRGHGGVGGGTDHVFRVLGNERVALFDVFARRAGEFGSLHDCRSLLTRVRSLEKGAEEARRRHECPARETRWAAKGAKVGWPTTRSGMQELTRQMGGVLAPSYEAGDVKPPDGMSVVENRPSGPWVEPAQVRMEVGSRVTG